MLRLVAGATFSLHSGALDHDSLIGQPDGVLISTNRGTRLLALRPTFAEHVVERKRRAQPIYPKDLGAILMHGDLYPGATVVEAGTGTGALTLAALRAVGPAGRVVSYELRPDFAAASRMAIEELDFDGLRFDFVKGFGAWMIGLLAKYQYQKKDGRDFIPFVVGEYWSGPKDIDRWLDQVRLVHFSL